MHRHAAVRGGGDEVARVLNDNNIILNMNLLPFEPLRNVMNPAGIRIGVQEMTRFGMKEPEMEEIGRLISRALGSVENETELAAVKRDVQKLCGRFPLYASRLKSYEEALASA